MCLPTITYNMLFCAKILCFLIHILSLRIGNEEGHLREVIWKTGSNFRQLHCRVAQIRACFYQTKHQSGQRVPVLGLRFSLCCRLSVPMLGDAWQANPSWSPYWTFPSQREWGRKTGHAVLQICLRVGEANVLEEIDKEVPTGLAEVIHLSGHRFKPQGI